MGMKPLAHLALSAAPVALAVYVAYHSPGGREWIDGLLAYPAVAEFIVAATPERAPDADLLVTAIAGAFAGALFGLPLLLLAWWASPPKTATAKFSKAAQRYRGNRFPVSCGSCGETIPVLYRVTSGQRRCQCCGEPLTVDWIDACVERWFNGARAWAKFWKLSFLAAALAGAAYGVKTLWLV